MQQSSIAITGTSARTSTSASPCAEKPSPRRPRDEFTALGIPEDLTRPVMAARAEASQQLLREACMSLCTGLNVVRTGINFGLGLVPFVTFSITPRALGPEGGTGGPGASWNDSYMHPGMNIRPVEIGIALEPISIYEKWGQRHTVKWLLRHNQKWAVRLGARIIPPAKIGLAVNGILSDFTDGQDECIKNCYDGQRDTRVETVSPCP